MARPFARAAVGLLIGASAGAFAETAAPIIGILTVPADKACRTSASNLEPNGIGDSAPSCFHSIYVKWVESAGGRVVPLLYDSPLQELDDLFGSLNGVLFTGGSYNISDMGSRYMQTAGHLLKRAIEANQAGQHVPVWGSCMGIQTLSILVAQDPAVLQVKAFDTMGLMMPIDLPAPSMLTESRLLRALPADVVTWMTSENVTVNLHRDGVLPETFATNAKLRNFFRVVSTNQDPRGPRRLPFVSTIEGLELPVYGVQWHPERVQFAFDHRPLETIVDHGPHAVRAMQAVANFFVDEARRNDHHFPSRDDEAQHLIYNYRPVGLDSDSAYLFSPGGSRAAEVLV